MIIRDIRFLGHNYTPDNLLCRESLVEKIYSNLKRGIYRVFLSGIRGTGKTISVEKALKKLPKKDYISIFINCSETPNFSSIAQKIIQEVRRKPYFVAGKNKSQISDDLAKMQQVKRAKHLVFVFDEIDKLINGKDNHQDVLFPLLNYGDSSFILISNDNHVLSKLDPRIRSRLASDIINVSAYSIKETFDILEQRAKLALFEKTYTIEAISEIAKNSASIGDIRFALKCLGECAKTAEELEFKQISKYVAEMVIEELDKTEFEQILISLPKQLQITLLAISIETAKNGEYAITYPNTYEIFFNLCKKEMIIPVGDRRFRDFLRELELSDLISLQNKSTNKRGGRTRVAIPNFNYRKFLERISVNERK